MGNLWYLFLAYGGIWAALLVYLYSIARRQESLRQEVKAIEEFSDADIHKVLGGNLLRVYQTVWKP